MINHSKPFIDEKITKNIFDLVKKGDLLNEKTRNNFKEKLKKYIPSSEVIITPSGSYAIYLALKMLNLRTQNEVILPSYLCSSVLWAVKEAGCVPVLCDIESHWNMTPANVQEKITGKTGAIIVVSMFGFSQNIEGYRNFKLPIINDLCQNFDDAYQAGVEKDLGDFFVFSFHPTKCLTAITGGGLGSRSSNLKLKLSEYPIDMYFPFSSLNATLASYQLENYHKFKEMRFSLAEKFLSSIEERFTFKILEKNDLWKRYRFPLWVENKTPDKIHKSFEDLGVSVRRGVDSLLHRSLNLEDHLYPNTVKAFENTISIPFYPALTHDEQERVVSAVKTILV